MCVSNKYLFNTRPHFCVTIFIVLAMITTANSLYQLTNSWDSFQKAHVLNPGDQLNSNFSKWTAPDWKAWFSYRMHMLHRTKPKREYRRINSVRHKHSTKPVKLVDVVTIANSSEVLEAFTGALMPYGTQNQAAFWSNKAFPTYVINRAGKSFRVYNCGKTYIAARLYDGQPEHLQDYYPYIIRNPLGGNLRYEFSRKCKSVRKFTSLTDHVKDIIYPRTRESRHNHKYSPTHY